MADDVTTDALVEAAVQKRCGWNCSTLCHECLDEVRADLRAMLGRAGVTAEGARASADVLDEFGWFSQADTTAALLRALAGVQTDG